MHRQGSRRFSGGISGAALSHAAAGQRAIRLIPARCKKHVARSPGTTNLTNLETSSRIKAIGKAPCIYSGMVPLQATFLSFRIERPDHPSWPQLNRIVNSTQGYRHHIRSNKTIRRPPQYLSFTSCRYRAVSASRLYPATCPSSLLPSPTHSEQASTVFLTK
jgi:hypothetical protein